MAYLYIGIIIIFVVGIVLVAMTMDKEDMQKWGKIFIFYNKLRDETIASKRVFTWEWI